ncbi:hypothetical protein [Neisseria montereyensis]|uniref:Uncharacterized protein n=1 Tax=Neisseria montereyensis TaxID=2973938 RepID=A0ABT2FAP2_9NEIS|nr:hypothetical protein [Neisseria montereyensis]MCS4533015.1 hypothetical protein [Neisseria montereyensis]
MNNLKEINPFKTTVKKSDFGILTTLEVDFDLSAKSGICLGEKTLLATDIYEMGDEYTTLVYTLIDKNGQMQSFVEEEGILPNFFKSPDEHIFVYVQPYDPDKDLDICIPVFNRENYEYPKRKRPFVGTFAGILGNYSILHDNWSNTWDDNKPDKMRAVEFKDGKVKKDHNSKIPLPKDNKIYVGSDEIHLLAYTPKGAIHRQIDIKANVIQERKLTLKVPFFREILHLSFTEDSQLISTKKGKIFLERVSKNGESEVSELIDIKDDIYATFKPEKIAENTFAIRFVKEFGNGWFVIREGKLLEFFYGNKGKKGYKNLLTDELIPMDDEDLIITELHKTAENNYTVIFYLRTEQGAKNKKLIILNRKVKG